MYVFNYLKLVLQIANTKQKILLQKANTHKLITNINKIL